MSVDPTVSVDRASLRVGERIAGRLAVTFARLLGRASPKRISGLLRLLRRGARPASYPEASRARHVVTNTSLRCSGPKGCLPRSIATVILCRLRGSWPTWCVGVRVAPPFGAHAWVMAEGRDVDEPYPPGYHRPLLRVEPSSPGHDESRS
jgi:hypothetical protein